MSQNGSPHITGPSTLQQQQQQLQSQHTSEKRLLHERQLSTYSSTTSVDGDYDVENDDVLSRISLPGWSIFDALFISWHDHPDAETSGSVFTDTPIARIQKLRRRICYGFAAILLLFAVLRLYSARYGNGNSPARASAGTDARVQEDGSERMAPYKINENKQQNRLAALFGWKSTGSGLSASVSSISPLLDYPLPPSYYASYYNASAPPTRLEPSPSRLAMLQTISNSRSSAFNPADFIMHHHDVLSHVQQGRDPIELMGKKALPTDQHPPLRLHAVAAILVHSPDYDVSGTQPIINMVAKYPFVREIIIWNNDIGFNLNENVITLPTTEDLGFLPPSLRIINSPSSFAPLADPIHRRLPAARAKHLACGLATKSTCLFLSPALLPIHLDAVYQAYLSTGPTFSQIVTVANTGDYYRLSQLRFENDAIDLHAGLVQGGIHTDPTTGNGRDEEMQETIVKRSLSRRFTQQVATLTPMLQGEEADIYWSLWMNTFPKILTGPALAIHDDQPTSAVSSKAPVLQKARDLVTLQAIRELHSALKAQDPFVSPDPFPIAPAPISDDTKAPCHDDKCVFSSNLSPFGRSISSLRFHKSSTLLGSLDKKGKAVGVDAGVNALDKAVGRTSSSTRKGVSTFDPFVDIDSLDDYFAAWHNSPAGTPGNPQSAQTQQEDVAFPPTLTEFQRQSNWYLAVNGRHPTAKTLATNATSCWTTPSNIDKNTFFGLQFLKARPVRTITLFGSHNLGNIVGKGLEDLTAESWEIWTHGQLASPFKPPTDWTRRALDGKVQSSSIGDSNLYAHHFSLTSIAGWESEQKSELSNDDLNGSGNQDGSAAGRDPIVEGDSTDEQVLRKRQIFDEADGAAQEASDSGGITKGTEVAEMPEIQGIRIVSRDRKGQAVRICGFDIDGWIV